MKPTIAVVGDYLDTSETHTALNKSLDYLKIEYDFDYQWIETDKVEKERERILKDFSGVWSAPGSPFKSLEGALYAITFARSENVPHLGTCAGFQHTVIELARNLLGIEDAHHEEYESNASKLFINKMECSLSGKTMEIYLKSDTLSHRLYSYDKTEENYYCSFGINPAFDHFLTHPQITVSGVDQDNEIRIIELPENKFFLVTLFVPQIRSLPNVPHPLIKGFVEAVCHR